MLFNWQNKCTEFFGEDMLTQKNATRRNTQPRQMPGYHETLRQSPGSVHHTESILLVQWWIVKNNCTKKKEKFAVFMPVAQNEWAQFGKTAEFPLTSCGRHVKIIKLNVLRADFRENCYDSRVYEEGSALYMGF